MEQAAFSFFPERRVYTVGELNAAIGETLGAKFAGVWVAGEISGAKLAASGHYYFTLKDRDSQVRCVAFRSAHRYWKFKPKDGVSVVARGSVEVYEPRGEYQLQVEHLEPQGHGALQFAFDQLKSRLASEGLFDSTRKRPLPPYPGRIGIVTSPKGAAIADMIHILSRRSPGVHVRLFPALVQGEGAAEEICRGIEFFSRTGWAQVVIVGRGGGSLEDLWAFNEERVARAIAACAPPVVSAVGHETDFTIADFVADLRAPTPSAAAELVVRDRQEVLDRLGALRGKLIQSARYRLSMLTRRLHQQGIDRPLGLLHRSIGRHLQRTDELDYRLREWMRSLLERGERTRRSLDMRLKRFDLRPRLSGGRRRMETAHVQACQIVRLRLLRQGARLDRAAARLEQLSPLRILDRGYSIVTTPDGTIVKKSAETPPGSTIHVRLAEGRLKAQVTGSG